ncbi:MAG: large-conductance mechanosensitive channel protein MscL [Bacteroidaceae bacterium]|nr:large-conductance mechanosensitive channel protein MscL [Bacteroidaceae bacterium]
MAKSSFIQEFKDFAMRGNVVDMAVGVIIGGAFGKIVTSVVNDILMPPIAMLMGNVNFTDMHLTLKEAQAEVVNEAGEVVQAASEAITWNYGAFIQNVIDFLIVAFCVFLLIKGINSMKKKEEEAPAPAPDPEPTKEEVLLTEIRDLLAKK